MRPRLKAKYSKRKMPVVLMDHVVDECKLCKMLIAGAWDNNPHRVAMAVLLRLEKMDESLSHRAEILNQFCIKLITHCKKLNAQITSQYLKYDPIIKAELDGIILQINQIKDCFYRETV